MCVCVCVLIHSEKCLLHTLIILCVAACADRNTNVITKRYGSGCLGSWDMNFIELIQLHHVHILDHFQP